MDTSEAVLLSQLPLVIMAVIYLFELRKIRVAVEKLAEKTTQGTGQ
ncbi:MAG: hypothetical protein V1744_03475 [Candidatus Altiarchaeota archaeon]